MTSPDHLRECPICGLFQTLPPLERGMAAQCLRCHSLLRQARTDPVGRGLALASASTLLFLLAISLPFLHLDLGSGRQTLVVSGPEALQQQGMWELGFVVLLTTMLAPAGKLLMTLWVLIGLRTGFDRRQLATVFRWVEWLNPWSMVEVFMLGVFVAYTKLGDLATIHVGGAVYALGALMLMMAATDAAIDPDAIWEQLDSPAMAAPTPSRRGQRLACDACGLVSHSASDLRKGVPHCPRCGSILRRRKPDSLARTWALTAAAAALYIPANILPVLTVIKLGQGAPSTILQGVQELASADQWPLAILVFVASIAVPVLKLLGMATLLVSTQRHMAGQLPRRTRLYKIVEAIGRWSMIDVFMISILTALVQMGTLATVTPGTGAICFCGVVILTMLAARTFDPRLMWDAARDANV